MAEHPTFSAGPRSTRRTLLIWAIAALLLIATLALMTIVAAGYMSGLEWTGLASRDQRNKVVINKTLWDWLQLLIIPTVLASATIWFNWTQRQRDQKIVEWNRETERRIADDQEKEAVLETYLSQMANLLLHQGLRTGAQDISAEVRQVARVQTLTALHRLDGQRRSVVVRFLLESHLIDRDGPIVDLKGVNLAEGGQWAYALSNRADVEDLSGSGANLEEVDLRGANLQKANLVGVNLRNAILRGAYLWDASLNGANLRGADLRWANLGGADLQKAILTGAELGHASLRGANLREAELRGAVWGEGADLSHADLSGARIDDAVLRGARLEESALGDVTNRDAETPTIRSLSPFESEFGILDGPRLDKADLTGSVLRGADLQNANLRAASLIDTCLDNAKLIGADLRWANLDGTELRGADLTGANLEGTIVTDQQLAAAKSTEGMTGSPRPPDT
jgi:uncharacterized protein YjbI with pentapeptide repeats